MLYVRPYLAFGYVIVLVSLVEHLLCDALVEFVYFFGRWFFFVDWMIVFAGQSDTLLVEHLEKFREAGLG